MRGLKDADPRRVPSPGSDVRDADPISNRKFGWRPRDPPSRNLSISPPPLVLPTDPSILSSQSNSADGHARKVEAVRLSRRACLHQ
ncbi:uncharacterized protein LAESUDRAFT_495893 [Laetiporus sulphureus 93-53]|uniref:Uncharacterized protein n=1 Tax=Laetiporus sulphureus 93-53 TaxID=1314785 RepID=A0A165BIB6_9APHY|nr:uncharacterized protein LAESUDRAFT_495893 [Laetiporus sulphureus 93-53]KZT01111.1 hypothetical protein LAESUDRAFT_495893 [Laetiporus sulphureus 93-53]